MPWSGYSRSSGLPVRVTLPVGQSDGTLRRSICSPPATCPGTPCRGISASRRPCGLRVGALQLQERGERLVHRESVQPRPASQIRLQQARRNDASLHFQSSSQPPCRDAGPADPPQDFPFPAFLHDFLFTCHPALISSAGRDLIQHHLLEFFAALCQRARTGQEGDYISRETCLRPARSTRRRPTFSRSRSMISECIWLTRVPLMPRVSPISRMVNSS